MGARWAATSWASPRPQAYPNNPLLTGLKSSFQSPQLCALCLKLGPASQFPPPRVWFGLFLYLGHCSSPFPGLLLCPQHPPPHPSFIPKPEGFLSRHGPSGCRPRGLSPSARATGLMNHKVFVIRPPRFASCVSLPSCSPGASSLSTLRGAQGSLLPPVLASCWLLNPKRSQLHKPCFLLHPPSTPQARPVWEPLVAQLVKYLPAM